MLELARSFMSRAIGPFDVEKKLSTGASAELLLAHYKDRPQPRLVLKVQLTQGISDDQRRTLESILREEVEHLKRWRHPGIVRIFPFRVNNRSDEKPCYIATEPGWAGQPWYFALEYLSGGRLSDHLGKIRYYPLGWRLELFYQLVLVVDYLHQQGYAHCDLKPDNIMFRIAPDAGVVPQPVLVDFGSVMPKEAFSEHITASLKYAAPELVPYLLRPDVGVRSDPNLKPWRADVWALGAIFFEIVTGRPMVNATNEHGAATIIRDQKFDPIGDEPDEIDRLFRFILQKRPPTEILRTIMEEQLSIRLPYI